MEVPSTGIPFVVLSGALNGNCIIRSLRALSRPLKESVSEYVRTIDINKITCDIASIFSTYPNMSKIYFYDLNFHDVPLEMCKNLQVLSLNRCQLREGLASFANFPSLQELQVT